MNVLTFPDLANSNRPLSLNILRIISCVTHSTSNFSGVDLTMISSTLRDKILEFTLNQISLADLEEWLVPQIPALIGDPNSEASDLVSAIELGIAELNAGILNKDSLVSYFQKVLSENTLIIINQNLTQSSASNFTPQLGTFESGEENASTISWQLVG